MSFEDDILIERFLKGELTSEEKKQISDRLESDSEFREKFQIEKQLFEALHEDSWSAIDTLENTQELEEYKTLFKSDDVKHLKETFATIGNQYEDEVKPKSSKVWYYYSGIAALLFVLLAVYFNVNQPKSVETLYVTYLESSELPSIVTRDTEDDPLYKAETLYNNGHYEDAIVAYNALLKATSTNKGTLYLYKGVSEMQLNKFSDAEQTFSTLIASESLDAPKGHWYKVLLYLKMNQIDKASKTLKYISDNKLFNYKKAKKLVKALEDVE